MNDAMQRAKQILAGAEATVNELKHLSRDLKVRLEFGLARKLLAIATEKDSTDIIIKQQLALCTYKDEELAHSARYTSALDILEQIGLRDPSNKNSETLALGGAIHKRMWEYGGQLEHLYEALSFYRAAYQRSPEADRGYGGVNAAYILQLLASRSRTVAKRSGTPPVEANKLDKQAEQLRKEMAEQLGHLAQENPELNNDYWFVVTLAEVLFGLSKYEEAGKWLAGARELHPPEWEKETTFRQLVSIARLQGAELPEESADQSSWHPAWHALANLMGKDTVPALSCYRGKVGLALSGGGFRASLFHLGLLARLAEMDVLRSLDVLSTVSGGSIVGAHYYLEVRRLLQEKPDKDITRDDYIKIIKRLQQDFLKGVQENLRTRALASFGKNLRMLFSNSYSRTHRMGELFEEKLYSKVQDSHPKGRPCFMHNLLIQPKGEASAFKPKFSNWRRRAKVPILLLNATSLNSGHNWQFTARWMGEPPGLMGSEVDKNARYRRLYYEQAPTEELRQFPLGHAVAASACVPVLFEPLIIEGLYSDREVRLVDGGVHDNQGVAGLLDEGCTFVFCSDASGQMEDQHKPSDGLVAVPLRSNSILMDRVREAQYQNLRGRLDSRSIQGLFFIHLKKDLPVPPVDWAGCQDPSKALSGAQPLTRYGVDYDLQRRLSAIRTDLDSFTEVEAYSLMCSGYLMTEHEFEKLQTEHVNDGEPGTWGGYDMNAKREDWPFLKLEPILKLPEGGSDTDRKDLGFQLDVASSLFFKLWRLNPFLRFTKWVPVVAGLLLLACLVARYWNATLWEITVGELILVIALLALSFVSPLVMWAFAPQRASSSVVRKIGIALFGALATTLHLHVFDKMFLHRGKLQRLLNKGRTTR